MKIITLLDESSITLVTEFMNEIPLNGTVDVIFEKIDQKRSLSQNAALFGVAYPAIMKEIGLRGATEMNELHEYFCGEYFGWHKYNIMGKNKLRPIRTTTKDEKNKKDVINRTDMGNFYSFIQQKCAEVGIIVPDPDKSLHIKKGKS